MTKEEYRRYCLSKKGATEDFPFDETAVVYKVSGKMFALADTTLKRITVKCLPEEAIVLREKYPSVIPGYYMNKKHWNTIMMDGSVKDKLIYRWLDDSYNLVVAGLSKNQRQELGS